MKYNVSLYYIIFFVLTCVCGLKCHQIIHLNRQNFFRQFLRLITLLYIYIEAIQCLLTIMEQKVFIFRYLKLLLQLFFVFKLYFSALLPCSVKTISRVFQCIMLWSCTLSLWAMISFAREVAPVKQKRTDFFWYFYDNSYWSGLHRVTMISLYFKSSLTSVLWLFVFSLF